VVEGGGTAMMLVAPRRYPERGGHRVEFRRVVGEEV
jgi:hypothetical protein